MLIEEARYSQHEFFLHSLPRTLRTRGKKRITRHDVIIIMIMIIVMIIIIMIIIMII